MVKILIAALVVLAGPAFAQGAGRYAVTGTSPDGSGYSGVATVAQVGDGVWSMTWQIGGDSYRGYGVGNGSVLAFAFSGGGMTGVASYTWTGSSYTGLWTTPSGRKAGQETLLPR